MTRPTTYLIRMAVFLVLVAIAVGMLSPTLWGIFWNNPGLNGLILLVLAIGIAWNLRQVLRLTPEVAWLEHYRSGPARLSGAPEARLLAPMARMLQPRQDDPDAPDQKRLTLSAGAMRSLLDSLASRLDESRELSRYMTGLLIFLGLLGTFWGLLKTIGAVADVIGAMTVGSGDVTVMFDQLKAGLARPLAGMGTAFSASLFGLAGALILGFLDLTAGQAQNRFFNELEEWLAGLTRLSSGALADGEGSVPVYVQALLEQTAENMESLRRVLLRGEESRGQAQQTMATLNEKIGALADATRSSQQLILRLADSTGGDDVSRASLRNIELWLQRIATEAEQGRTETTTDLRNDLRLLTRAVAALAEEKR
jgi:MotA/TolQ/ExbB proton channel family